MGADSLDDAFVKLNDTAHLVPNERVEEARRVQSLEIAQGGRPRSLIAILKTQGDLDDGSATAILEQLSGPAEAPDVNALPPVAGTITRFPITAPAIITDEVFIPMM